MSENITLPPLDWKIFSLEDISSHITSGGTPTSGDARYYVEGTGLPFAKTEDLTRSTSKYVESCELSITPAALKESAAKKYPVGTILISMYGTIGLTKITACEMAANQALCALLPPFSCDRDYLFHHLEFIRNEWLAFSGQTTQANINGAVVRSKKVPLPPAKEQVVIAKILDSLDTTIHQTEAILEKLKQVKQGLLHDLLTRGIDANGELRPSQSEAPELYKESALGWIPMEWESTTVGDSCALNNGLRFPIASDVRAEISGPYPYYGPTGILDHINEYRVDGTFVLIGEDGDHFLKFDKWPMTQLVSGKFNVNNHAHLLSGVTCFTEWIDAWFRHRDITLFLTRQGAGRFKLNKVSLLTLPIAIPSKSEQSSILSAFTLMDARLATEQKTREKLLAQKSGLMDDLLTGRVRVTPLLNNPD